MIDYITCKIDSIGYDFYGKKHTVNLNIGYQSVKCYAGENIVTFASDFYQNHNKVVVLIQSRSKKLYITNIRKLEDK